MFFISLNWKQRYFSVQMSFQTYEHWRIQSGTIVPHPLGGFKWSSFMHMKGHTYQHFAFLLEKWTSTNYNAQWTENLIRILWKFRTNFKSDGSGIMMQWSPDESWCQLYISADERYHAHVLPPLLANIYMYMFSYISEHLDKRERLMR